MATFGELGSSTSFVTRGGDSKVGTYFVLSEDGTVQKLTAYLDKAVSNFWVVGGIYQYIPGSAFLGGTGSINVTSSDNTWYDLNLITELNLSAGSYVLALNSDNAFSYAKFDDNNRSATDPNTFPTWETGWINGSDDFTIDDRYSIYATYTPSGEPVNYIRTESDVLNIIDTFNKILDTKQSLTDIILCLDANNNVIFLTKTDFININDTFINLLERLLQISDYEFIRDDKDSSFIKINSELVDIKDRLVKQVDAILSESDVSNYYESNSSNIIIVKSENYNILESFLSEITKLQSIVDILNISEENTLTIELAKDDLINLTEQFSKISTYNIIFNDSIFIRELIQKGVTISVDEFCFLSDIVAKIINSVITKNDTHNLNDSTTKTVSINKKEIINHLDEISKSFEVSYSDNGALSDEINSIKSLVLSLSDELSLNDVINFIKSELFSLLILKLKNPTFTLRRYN